MNHTITDTVTATILIKRVLLRDFFNRIKSRPQAKYWKHIVIKDKPWNLSQKNIPKWFYDNYPTDFEASYDSFGCNIIKCYKDNYCEYTNEYMRVNGCDDLIACGGACKGVYREFFDFLEEEFNLTNPHKTSEDFPFDTLSIAGNFCGLELTTFKTIAARPSSRGDEPGLIDAPPLTWNVQKQDIKFNKSYCERFRKLYDSNTDTCYFRADRKVANFILGTHVIDQVGHNPYLGIKDPLHTVEPFDIENIDISQPVISNKPTKIIHSETINQHDFSKIIRHVSHDSKLLSFFSHLAITIAECELMIRAPVLISHLLRYFSENILRKIVINCIPKLLVTRLFVMIIRTGLVEWGISIALRLLSAVSTTLSVIFNIGLITIPLEILFAFIDLGGYQKEFTRTALNEQRKNLQRDILRATFGLTDKFIQFGDSPSYVTPNITPEIVYHLSLNQFHKIYSKDDVDCVERDGLSPNLNELVEEYLSHLDHNSLGQKITPTSPVHITINYDLIFKRAKIYSAERSKQLWWDTKIFLAALIILLISLLSSNNIGLTIASFIFIYWGMTSEFLDDLT